MKYTPMKQQFQHLTVAVCALWLCGCSSTSIKQSWKSPAFQSGQVQKIAVVAVDDRGLVRQGFENRLVTEMRSLGQGSITTFNLLGLPEMKADKEAAATQLRAAGADAVFVVRLVDQVTYEHQVQATPALYVPTIDGYAGYGWYDCYSVAFMNMGVVFSETTRDIYLDSSLFDLKSGKRLWSVVTMTALKEDADRLAIVDALVAKVGNAMRKDGIFTH
jgi:hypothetical protein